MEADGGGQEVLGHLLMKTYGRLDKGLHRFCDPIAEATLLEMGRQNAAVDGGEPLRAREMDGKYREMSLQSQEVRERKRACQLSHQCECKSVRKTLFILQPWTTLALFI